MLTLRYARPSAGYVILLYTTHGVTPARELVVRRDERDVPDYSGAWQLARQIAAHGSEQHGVPAGAYRLRPGSVHAITVDELATLI